jgi:hypothetical protein
MTKFNYKKWLTKNRDGQPNINYINEQIGSLTYVGCSLCPPGSTIDNNPLNDFGEGLNTGGYYNCPPQEFVIPTSDTNQQNQSPFQMSILTANEYVGSDPEVLAWFAGEAMFGNGNPFQNYSLRSLESWENGGYFCSSSGVPNSNYQPFCCDINAVNFGQMASGQPYGMNPGEPEQYLMQNGPQGDMCDNSICQGNVNVPDPEGMPFDDKAGADSGGDDDQQAQQADKAFKKNNRRRGDRRDPKGQSTKDNRLRETWNKLKKSYKNC